MELNENSLLNQRYYPRDIMINNGKNGKPLWIVIHNKVYDVTNFNHPGGKDVFHSMDEDDLDKGDEFDSIHSKATKKTAKTYLIGKLVAEEKTIKINKDNNEIKSVNEIIESSNGSGKLMLFVLIVILILVIILAKSSHN